MQARVWLRIGMYVVLFAVYLASTVPVGLFIYSVKTRAGLDVFRDGGFHAYMACLSRSFPLSRTTLASAERLKPAKSSGTPKPAERLEPAKNSTTPDPAERLEPPKGSESQDPAERLDPTSLSLAELEALARKARAASRAAALEALDYERQALKLRRRGQGG